MSRGTWESFTELDPSFFRLVWITLLPFAALIGIVALIVTAGTERVEFRRDENTRQEYTGDLSTPHETEAGYPTGYRP
jgi:hypothetical protein